MRGSQAFRQSLLFRCGRLIPVAEKGIWHGPRRERCGLARHNEGAVLQEVQERFKGARLGAPELGTRQSPAQADGLITLPVASYMWS